MKHSTFNYKPTQKARIFYCNICFCTFSGPGDSRGGLGSAVSGYSSISSKEVSKQSLKQMAHFLFAVIPFAAEPPQPPTSLLLLLTSSVLNGQEQLLLSHLSGGRGFLNRSRMSTIQSRRPEKKAIKKHCKVNPKIPMKILFDQKTAQLL